MALLDRQLLPGGWTKPANLSGCHQYIWVFKKLKHDQGERAKRASRRYRGRGPGRDGSDDVLSHRTPPRGMNQSGSNFQGIIRTYGRMHIYKISLIGLLIVELKVL